MEIHNYIINDVQPLDLNTSISDVRRIFKQLTLSHLPVKSNGDFLGSISETDASCFDFDKTIADYQYAVEPFHVLEDTIWLEVLEAFADHNCNIMPVLGAENQYLGYYELSDIISLFNKTPFLNEKGRIIVIEKGIRDYSFSEICQIVESNGVRIYGLFISQIRGDTIQVTLKVGQAGMNSEIQTFRRYNYRVVSHHEEDKFLQELKQRSQYLDKYLNI